MAATHGHPGPHHPREDVLTLDRVINAGAHVARLFQAQEMLAGLTDVSALLAGRFRLVEHHRVDQELRFRDGRAQVESSWLRLTTGLRFQAEIDATGARLLAYLDGRRTLADAIERTARETPENSGRAARERFTRAALAVIVRMLEAGFLEPVT